MEPVNLALSALKDVLGPIVAGELADAWRLPKRIQQLQTTLPKIRTLIDRAEWLRFKDKNVASLLINLKQTKYDTEDLLDQFAYRVLHQKVDPSNQVGYTWRTFCIDFLYRHAHALDDMQQRLDHCASQLKEVIDLLDSGDSSYQYSKSAVTSSTSCFITESEVLGRESELKKLVDILLKPNDGFLRRGGELTKRIRRENVHVLPIVGIGGLGKTTLAQMIYNHTRIQNHFDLKIWVCVSDIFDVMRITKEMVDCATNGEGSDVMNLSFMQATLTSKVSSKRFLLILDNIWNENITEWERLFAPLRNGVKGSMILVTTRSLKVAEVVGTMKPFFIEGLLREPYRNLFERCAFGAETSSNYPQLVLMARRIADGLKGSPLAAKTLGSLLNSNKNERHWRAVMNSEIWELPQKENDILPALKLSYLYLPAHLKQCFSFCSMFPKDYNLRKDLLIDMWVTQGFITNEKDRKLEDIGNAYLNELVMRSFFQKSPQNPELYVIHDLMWDLAHSVSDGEYFRIEDRNYHQDIPDTVRHLSVCAERTSLSKLEGLCSYKNLRSIIILTSLRFDVNPAMELWCRYLRQLRCLKIDAARLSEFPSNIMELQQLRYLNVLYDGIRSLPQCFYSLHHLQFLYLKNWNGWDPNDEDLSSAFSKLVNLRRVYPVHIVVTRMARLGKLTNLQELHTFKIERMDGHRISELEHMNELHNRLNIKNLENVENKEQADQAKLYNKQYLNELTLEWSRNNIGNSLLNSNVLESLQPHSNLSELHIKGYLGSTSPSWLNKQNLSCLSTLILDNCIGLKELMCLGPSLTKLQLKNVGLNSLPELWDDDSNERSALSNLYIESCPNIVSMANWILPKNIPAIKSISIMDCIVLKELPTNGLEGHDFLENLKIGNCPELNYPKVLPSSLKTLDLDFCDKIHSSFPHILKKLTSLVTLKIERCSSRMKSAQVLSHLTSLKSLSLRDCKNLCSLSGLQALELLENLRIFGCPQLVIPSRGVINLNLPSLQCLKIDDPAFLKHQIRYTGDPLPKLWALEIWNSDEKAMFLDEDDILFNIAKSIKQLSFINCSNLLALPPGLARLAALETLFMNECPQLESLPEMPPSLRSLRGVKCPNLEQQLAQHELLDRRIPFEDF